MAPYSGDIPDMFERVPFLAAFLCVIVLLPATSGLSEVGEIEIRPVRLTEAKFIN